MGMADTIMFLVAQYFISLIIYLVIIIFMNVGGINIGGSIIIFTEMFTLVQVGMLVYNYIVNKIRRRKTNKMLSK